MNFDFLYPANLNLKHSYILYPNKVYLYVYLKLCFVYFPIKSYLITIVIIRFSVSTPNFFTYNCLLFLLFITPSNLINNFNYKDIINITH